MRDQDDILSLIAADPWMMAVLGAARRLELPDCWIGAGFVRRKVWDHLHGFAQATPLDDIDLLYFQAADTRQAGEQAIEERLRQIMPGQPWSAKNQARMHLRNGDHPYAGTVDAMRHWLETPTCVAVRLAANGKLELVAPFGIDDLLHLIIRPTPAGQRRERAYRERLENKQWLQNWPKTRAIWP
ncbi:MAG: nucleotidyltransferase family protein [Alphaproteobacteria bacterium]|nr:nucleotidyltransferase family protein [Alphaproteobacteria bacterium]MBL6954921.1 nucleotidyltransferase family protein [Alphaproteobacteria bacterium]